MRGVWCQALSLPRPPVLWSGQPGFRDPCVPGAVSAGVGTQHRPHMTLEEDELSEECVCEPPRVCLFCHRPPETVERDLRYAYQGLKDTTKDAEPVEDHLPASIHQGASNLHSDEDIEDKITLLDPRVQKQIRTYLESFQELPPSASCDKLVQMDLKLKPEFMGQKIRRRRYPAPKEQADENRTTDTRMYRRWPGPGVQGRGLLPTLQPLFPGGRALVYSQTAGNGLWRAEQEDVEPLRVHP